MWTVDKITKLCIEYCGKAGVKFNSPVYINGRLTRTLGRCFYVKNGSVWNPFKMEFSRQLLETATEESILNVIMHECAHYVTCALTHENHGHDSVFRHYCEVIGTDNNGTIYHNLERNVNEESVYKYTIYCTKCGAFLSGRSRLCKIVKEPSCFHSTCCDAPVKVIKNW